MSGLQVSRDEILECQEIVNNFRVNELNLLLTSYNYPKLGKKHDLVQRAKSLLTNSKYQLSAVQKIREIHASTRMRQAPYNIPNPPGAGVSSAVAVNNTDMRRHQFMGNPSRNALHQAVNNIGQPFGGGGGGANLPGFGMFNSYAGTAAAGGMYAGFGGSYPTIQQPLSHISGGLGSSGGSGSAGSSSSGQARNLRMVTLPFYDLKSVTVPLTELPAFNIQPRPGEARHLCQFGFAPEEISRLYYKSEDKPLPRYEIQLRMFQLDTNKEQEDAFPPGCIVKLDDYNVTLPNVIPTNKPNAEQKRLSRPVNLTGYCHPPRTHDRPHRMLIEWSGDKRAWAFGIFIVFHVSATILQERLLQNVAARRSFQSTKSIIIRRLNGDDDDGIEMDALKISLLCPLMRTRIKLPARAIDCTHLQFFDLTNYLLMCEKRPVWKCPVCDNQALYSKLIIDQYFQKLLESTDKTVDDVELLKDGSWRVFKEELVGLSDDDGDDVVIAPTTKRIVPVAASASSSPKSVDPASVANRTATHPAMAAAEPNCDVITLSSDDEDESGSDREDDDTEINENESATSRPGSTEKANSVDASSRLQSEEHAGSDVSGSHKTNATNPPPKSNNKANDSDVIMLSDSDDEDNGRKTDSVGTSASANGALTNGVAAAAAATAVVTAVGDRNNAPMEVDDVMPPPVIANGFGTHRNGMTTATVNHAAGRLPSSGIFQANGMPSNVFRPVIDEVAKNHVAKELATFLQNVCAKNSISYGA